MLYSNPASDRISNGPRKPTGGTVQVWLILVRSCNNNGMK